MKTKRKKEWFDDDAFWKDMYPYMFPKERFKATPEQAKKLLALAKPKGKKVLDLCCGPGRFSIALAKAGYQVTGVDRTRYLLNKARAKARAAKARIEWIEQDMRDFVREESFDLVISMFTSFGYFDNKGEDLQVLRNMYASLKPGGVCVVDVIGKERIAKIFLPSSVDTLEDGSKLVELREVFDDWTRIRNEWIILRNGRAKSYKLHHTLYSGQELKDLLKQAGFTRVKLYGSFDGDAYGPDALRLIAVARKRY